MPEHFDMISNKASKSFFLKNTVFYVGVYINMLITLAYLAEGLRKQSFLAAMSSSRSDVVTQFVRSSVRPLFFFSFFEVCSTFGMF